MCVCVHACVFTEIIHYEFVPSKQSAKYSGTSISRTSRETKKYLSYRSTFFLLIFQLNLHQAYVLQQEKHGEGSSDFLFTEHITLNRENFPPLSKRKFELQSLTYRGKN
jgi:hypothetical protein